MSWQLYYGNCIMATVSWRNSLKVLIVMHTGGFWVDFQLKQHEDKTKSFSSSNYFLLSWRWLVILVILIVYVADAARTWVVLPSFLASLLLMTSISKYIERNKTLWNVAVLGALGFFVFNQAFFVSTPSDLASLMIEVLVGVFPVALAGRYKPRLFWFSLLNAILIAVGSALVSESLEIYVLLLGFMVAVVFCLNAANLYFVKSGSGILDMRLPRGFILGVVRTFPGGLLAGALIFFLFPRAKNLNSWLGLEGEKSKTGYTGSISLTGGREISESESLVFLAESNDGYLANIYVDDLLFRGSTLEDFDGKSWTKGKSPSRIFSLSRGKRQAKSSFGNIHTITVFREPTYNRVLFYPGILVGLDDTSRKLGGVFIDNQGSLRRGSGGFERFSYGIIISEAQHISAASKLTVEDYDRSVKGETMEVFTKFDLSDTETVKYTTVPEAILSSDYFLGFKNSVLSRSPVRSITGIALSLKNYFAENFEASLINKFSAADTLKAFLTTDRRGHCEYFATVTALFFRSLGVPTRIALGYRGGVFNRVSQLLEVREKNAHAWVEIFVPRVGWVSFDSTPVSVGREAVATWNIQFYLGALEFWFNRYVIDYDRDAQAGIFQSIQNINVIPRLGSSFEFRSVKGLLFPLLLLVLLIGLVFTWRKIRKARGVYRYFPEIFRLYLNKLEKNGLQIEVGETLFCFQSRVLARASDRDLVSLLGLLLEQYLYGAKGDSDSQFKLSDLASKDTLWVEYEIRDRIRDLVFQDSGNP